VKYVYSVILLFCAALLIIPNIETPGQTILTTFLPGDETPGPAAFNQEQPAISRGGNQYLTVWTDYRSGGSPLIIVESGADIFAARLDASGELIDSTPILISMEAADQISPKIAWNGQNWLVAWLSQTPTQFFWSMEVQAVRVSPAGQVLDPTPISIYKYPSSSSAEFAIDSDGNNWVIVTRGTDADENDLLGVRVAPDGTVLDPDGVVLVPGTFSLTFNLDLAFAVDEYLLTYLLFGDVNGLRLETDLQLKDPAPFQITDASVSVESPRTASNGVDFFVAWREYNSGTQYGEARGTRISYDGQVLDPGGLAISGPMFIGANDPRVTWDGQNWLVTFKEFFFGDDPDDLRASRVTTSGQVIDFGGVSIEPVATAYNQPELTGAISGGTQIVWRDQQAGGSHPYDISTFSITQELTPTIPIVVSYSAPAQTQVDTAASGTGYMAVFRSTVSSEHRIMAHPLDPNGNALLPEPVQLDSGSYLASPAVAWNGSLYFVIWSDVGPGSLNDSKVYGQRINADGSLVDPVRFEIMEGFSADVASAGDLFLVVAIQQTFSPQIREPFGVRVQGSDGSILDPVPIDLGFSFARLPSVAGLGDRWLMSYQRNFTHDDPNAEIMANFIEMDGSTSGSFQVATSLNPFFYNPATGSDGIDSLVIWHDSGSDDIEGARVLGDGTVLPTFTIIGTAEVQKNPALVWDDTRYVALYQDLRNASFFLDERSDIFGTRLDAEGDILDPDGFPVYSSWIPEIDPAVSGANGVALLASAIFRDTAPYMSYRVGVDVMGEPLPTPTPTNTPTETALPSATPTSTATFTVSPSPTSTSTPTATQITDPSATPTPTEISPPGEERFLNYIPFVIR
jgi:hypothetical protein